MTWNELIARLNEIPEGKRNQKAIFVMSGHREDVEEEIDGLQLTDEESVNIVDPEVGEEEMIYVLTP